MKTTIRKLLDNKVEFLNDTIEESTLSNSELDAVFDDQCDGYMISDFTAWGIKFIYFPATYDGGAWIESVPRHPCQIKTDPFWDGEV